MKEFKCTINGYEYFVELDKIDNFFTHGSKFHADEICSLAIIDLAAGQSGPAEEMIVPLRVNEEELAAKATENSFIFDIGGGKYDHHFRDKPELKKFYPEDYSQVKGELIEKSACARIWEDFGKIAVRNVLGAESIINDDLVPNVAEIVDREFISKISDTDTRGQFDRPNEYAAIVTRRWEYASSVCVWEEGIEYYFNRLVEFFYDELYTRIFLAYKKLIKELAVEELSSDMVELGHPTWINLTESWEGEYIQAHMFAKTNIRYTIVKSDRIEGQWNLQSVDVKKYPLDACKTMEGFVKNPIAPLVIFDSKESAEKAATELSKM